ncbi:MAG: PIN domain-containing protein [Candidatus Thiodiazotropha sp.]
MPDCIVQNHEELIDLLELPDPNDRHVLAAAIMCQADVIVTNNLKDFPQEVMDQYHIDVQ